MFSRNVVQWGDDKFYHHVKLQGESGGVLNSKSKWKRSFSEVLKT